MLLFQKNLPQVVILAGVYHREISDGMLQTALEYLAHDSVDIKEIIEVPGAYEIPLATQKILQEGGVDVIIALAYIEKGETLDGEVMGHAVNGALVNLQLGYGKPIGIACIGPGATLEQAKVRIVSKTQGACKAALAMHRMLVKRMSLSTDPS